MKGSSSSSTSHFEQDDLRERFIFLAQALADAFPELDLRFNLRNESTTVRLIANAVSRDVHELDLDLPSLQMVIHEGMFLLKQVAGRYDA